MPFSRELYIERDDFMEDPPKKFFRLAPGREVRLRYGYFITCTEVVKDAVRRDHRAALHVRSGDARRRLARWPEGAGDDSLGVGQPGAATASCGCTTSCSRSRIPTTVEEGKDFLSVAQSGIARRRCRGAKVEPSVVGDPLGSRYQFERTGYFISDPVDSRPGRWCSIAR